MKPEIKKLLILNLPYLLFVWLFDKVGAAVRLSPGADASAKLLHLGDGFTAAFSSIAPSFHPADLALGIAGAVIVRLIIYTKGKNAKKYRRGTEYGSARWGGADDIKPYTDPVFENNIILTETERLTMNSRPKAPKYARNKNVIVIGRQYGCGGHDIGKKLAEKFGYEFYDQEIIQMIAGTTGMTSEFIRQKEESMTNSLLYDFVNQMYLYGKEEEEAPKDKIFEAESKVIRELAAKGK